MKRINMKKLVSLLLCFVMALALIACGASRNVDGVAIDETNFPDKTFRNYVKENFDADGDGGLSDAEIAAVKSVRVNELGITSLQGLEFFTALEALDCSDNQLTALDIGANTALAFLRCSDNKLTALDVTATTSLKWLECAGNQLTELNVSYNTEIDTLDCSSNQLTALNVSANTKLTNLFCHANRLTVLDVSACPALVSICALGTLSEDDNYICYQTTFLTLLADKTTELVTESN